MITIEQNNQLWELFCAYGRLRREAEYQLSARRDLAAYRRLNAEADLEAYRRLNAEALDVWRRFSDMIWSLTRREDMLRQAMREETSDDHP